ncbi:class I SAM-dependent methyltransferase [Aminobacter sp. AP02]|uniref:class I SAM-dependent methyltransferase n=1 Tax=Aminobacter sp. AP02 TaxID=2135737 RepID=UPI000D7AB10A|nr:class I SAM-dependent methyltransferase [Aminobacter sp. AP02]PWK65645.1 methyltransferase family protein [Aminobacter sp. AP02]
MASNEVVALDFPPDWGCRLMERQGEFMRAERILEIGGGDFSRVISLAIRHPNKQFVSVDFRYEAKAIANVSLAAALPNVNFIKINALDRFFADELFDFVFSIALMEHIPQLERFLSVVHALLAPRGTYAFFQAPFWSSKTGHHFRHSDPAVRNVLNSYEHIRFDADEMRAYLKTVQDLPFDIEDCVRMIYARPDLSRLSSSESKRIALSSSFVIDTWDERLDKDFDESQANVALATHSGRYTLDDFHVDAVFARLVKM